MYSKDDYLPQRAHDGKEDKQQTGPSVRRGRYLKVANGFSFREERLLVTNDATRTVEQSFLTARRRRA
ncbi:hypothetical protein [Amycolatopsis sp. CA-230715]|uniref:hypothetical protein n=1 Tax=Amycolatopsis sp. CA-230715 TaxID=2745196 RepID=UPI001C029FF7|nr:hypothetical protein [Amycolatopsis sp. CA-230715]